MDRNNYKQLNLLEPKAEYKTKKKSNGTFFSDPAFAGNKTLPIHRWVPWVAGFSSDFVQDALTLFLKEKKGVVLDPFAGVGTTLVEALVTGHSNVGFEINPYASLACKTKVNAAQVNRDEFLSAIKEFVEFCTGKLKSQEEPSSTPPEGFNTRAPFYSPAVLRKVLFVLDFIETLDDVEIRDLFRVAFASTMITYSNYSYEPSLGRKASAGRPDVIDYDVVDEVESKLKEFYVDIEWMQEQVKQHSATSKVINDSFFEYKKYIEPDSVDLIITSPPYVNNYHYNRNTRPHLYWLGYATKPKDLKPLEHKNFGTYWQTARDVELIELGFELPESDLHEKLTVLRETNAHKGVYGGHGWANYASAYFNDCLKFAEGIKYSLKKGGTALVVIGPSILQGVFIATDKYLGEIAEYVGLELIDIHIPRTARVGNSIIQSEVRSEKANNSASLYEAVVEIKKP